MQGLNEFLGDKIGQVSCWPQMQFGSLRVLAYQLLKWLKSLSNDWKDRQLLFPFWKDCLY